MEDMTPGRSDVPVPPPPPEGSLADADEALDVALAEDTTGIAALLAALPDPGPMPADVALRIESALRAEQVAGAASALDDTAGDVVPLQALSARGRSAPAVRRSGRRWGVVMAAAAGGVFAVVVGQSILTGLQSGSTSTAGSAPAQAGAQDKGVGGASAAPEANGATSGSFSVDQSSSGTAYSSTSWLKAAARLAGGIDAGAAAQGPSTDALTGCLAGLGVSPAQRLRVDLGTFEGAPAMIIILDDRRAFAVKRTCSAAAPGLLASGLLP